MISKSMQRMLIISILFFLLILLAPQSQARPVDIVIVFDTTSSMSGVIDTMRQKAKQAIQLVRERSGDDVRLALVSFRDIATDGRDAFVVTPFSKPSSLDGGASLEETLKVMDTWSALGGGDTPEDQLFGIHKGISLWVDDDDGGGRTSTEAVLKTVIPFTDAGLKDPDVDGRTSETIADFAESVDPAHIYPIVIGNNADALEDAEKLARLTGGVVSPSTDASAVVDAFLNAVEQAKERHQDEVKPQALKQALPLIIVVLLMLLG